VAEMLSFCFQLIPGVCLSFLSGSSVVLLSKEGVTQGDPLAMLVYALCILPLIRKLKRPEKWKQNWYADDSACLAQLINLREWLNILMLEGPKYGYFPEPQKSYLVVHSDYLKHAQEFFKDFNINIVTGRKFLGGYIGGQKDVHDWIVE
jgi:hypothetical protein